MKLRGLVIGVCCWSGMFFTFPLVTAAPPQDKPAPEPPEVKMIQVHPVLKDPDHFTRSEGKGRAVVLIHGYWLHFTKDRVRKAIFKDWQHKDSPLVTTLGKDSDVFAVAYGQSVSVEEIAGLRALGDGIARLKKLGYGQIVLVGHSAGGLVAREFVEDHPQAGVTKVIQVCAPNGGSVYADIKLIPKNQRPFVDCLCKTGREKCLLARARKKIPAAVQFVCVITAEDLVVPCRCQWTPDLQDQGVPALRIDLGHRQVMRKTKSARMIADIVRQRQPRWSLSEVTAVRNEMFKPKKAN